MTKQRDTRNQTKATASKQPLQSSQEPDEKNVPCLDDLIRNLPSEFQTVLLAMQLHNEQLVQKVCEAKEKEILSLKSDIVEIKQELTNSKTEVEEFRNQITALKSQMEEQAERTQFLLQAQHRNVMVLGGNDIPRVEENECPKKKLIAAVKDHLRYILKEDDISEVSRIGPKPNSPIDKRPLKFKMNDCALRGALISACITYRPRLFLNEFLTPVTKLLLDKVLEVKKRNPQLVKICYVRDGVIIVKQNRESRATKIRTARDLNAYLSTVEIPVNE